MKRISLTFLLLISFAFGLFAQGDTSHYIGLNTGLNFTKLTYVNSQKESLNYSTEIKPSFGFSYTHVRGGFSYNFSIDRLFIGSSYSNQDINTSINAEYVQPSISLNYYFNKPTKRISPTLGAGIAQGVITNADQTLNNENYNLLSSERFNRFDTGLLLFGGITAFKKDIFRIEMGYSFRYGVSNLEKDINNQITKSIIHGAQVKFQFAL